MGDRETNNSRNSGGKVTMNIDDLTIGEARKIAAMFPAETPALASRPECAAVREPRPVIVCTDKRGVFFGYATDTTGDPIYLDRARMAVYWSADVRGVMGLAVTGPTAGCRIGPAVTRIELRGITAVIECDPAAVAAWEASPWTR